MEEVSKEINDGAQRELGRIREINFIYLDESLNDGFGYVHTSDGSKKMTIDQSDSLDELDEKIYTVFKENLGSINGGSEYDITRMGIEDGSYSIENRMYYYDLDNGDYEEKLEKINLDTINSIKEDEDTMEKLKDNNINTIKIIFHSKWYESGDPLIFTYDVF